MASTYVPALPILVYVLYKRSRVAGMHVPLPSIILLRRRARMPANGQPGSHGLLAAYTIAAASIGARKDHGLRHQHI